MDCNPVCHQNPTEWSLGHATPFRKFHQNPLITFWVIYWRDGQTDKQTDTVKVIIMLPVNLCQWQWLLARKMSKVPTFKPQICTKYLARWYILCVNCPAVYLPLSNGDIGCTPSVAEKGSFLRTSMPSPPPVSALLASATEYNCATWYYNGTQNHPIMQLHPIHSAKDYSYNFNTLISN